MFERALIESQPGMRPGARLALLPVALALHAIALAVVATAQLWAVEEVPPPVIEAALYLGTFTPAGATGSPPAQATKRRTPVAPPREDVQPATVREAADVPAEPAPASGSPEFDPDATPGGDGPPGGVGEGPPGSPTGPTAALPAEPRTDTIYLVGGEVAPPVAIYRVAPGYPDAARVAHRQGIVLIKAIVDASGNVTEAHILADRVGFGAGESALRAVQAWRYEPATLHGRSVPVSLIITVVFALQ
ncbi:MAG: TonB family protein [Acidobacteriota bacterium]